MRFPSPPKHVDIVPLGIDNVLLPNHSERYTWPLMHRTIRMTPRFHVYIRKKRWPLYVPYIITLEDNRIKTQKWSFKIESVFVKDSTLALRIIVSNKHKYSTLHLRFIDYAEFERAVEEIGVRSRSMSLSFLLI
jgi:hypothetical protein